MDAAQQQHVVDDDRTVRRTVSNEDAPFTVDDLQSELSNIPNGSEMHQSSVTPDSKPFTNASGLHETPFNGGASSQVLSQSLPTTEAAAARGGVITGPAKPAETAESRNEGAEVSLAEQQASQSPSADSSAGITTTPLSHASLHPETSASPRYQPEQGTPTEERPSSTEAAAPGTGVQEDSLAAPGIDVQEDSLAAGSRDAGITSPGNPAEQYAATGLSSDGVSTSQSEPSAAPTTGLAAHSVIARDASPYSEQLPMHVSQQPRESSWTSDAFPADTTDAKAAAPEASTDANTDLDLGGSLVQVQGQPEGGDNADEAETQQRSADDASQNPSTAAESHTSKDQTLSPLEMQTNDDSEWADGDSAEAPASVNMDIPGDGAASQHSAVVPAEPQTDDGDWADAGFAEAPLSGNVDIPTDGSTNQNPPKSAMPTEPEADDSQWADNAFAAATTALDAEQTASLAPSLGAHAAVTGPDETDGIDAQAKAASSERATEELLVESSAPNAELLSSTAATTEADTAATTAADTVAGTNSSEQLAEQQEGEDDWGDDDDFGDFNDAANDGNDEGFGTFNEADTGTTGSADASVHSPEKQQQAPHSSTVPPSTSFNQSCSTPL